MFISDYESLYIIKRLWDMGLIDELSNCFGDDKWGAGYEPDVIIEAFFSMYTDITPEQDDIDLDDSYRMLLNNPVMDELGQLCTEIDKLLGKGAHVTYIVELSDKLDSHLRRHNSYYACSWHYIPEETMKQCCIEIEYFNGWGFDIAFIDCWINIYLDYKATVTELKEILAQKKAKVIDFPIKQELEVAA